MEGVQGAMAGLMGAGSSAGSSSGKGRGGGASESSAAKGSSAEGRGAASSAMAQRLQGGADASEDGEGQGVVNVTFGDGLTRNGKPRRSAEECPQCGQCFVDAALLERHVKQVHKRRSECAGGEKCTIS
eukprot:TRINITY_DN3031_c0_g1_i7.p1 TRINITY_DN3031_c0_g1~~TRINITY_DN3031_c0_g1_i7.p1  ORF type:complete len:129 (+),score=5.67 TRINITY_DN3031_c0_g1_i7:318-704(+)